MAPATDLNATGPSAAQENFLKNLEEHGKDNVYARSAIHIPKLLTGNITIQIDRMDSGSTHATHYTRGQYHENSYLDEITQNLRPAYSAFVSNRILNPTELKSEFNRLYDLIISGNKPYETMNIKGLTTQSLIKVDKNFAEAMKEVAFLHYNCNLALGEPIMSLMVSKQVPQVGFSVVVDLGLKLHNEAVTDLNGSDPNKANDTYDRIIEEYGRKIAITMRTILTEIASGRYNPEIADTYAVRDKSKRSWIEPGSGF